MVLFDGKATSLVVVSRSYKSCLDFCFLMILGWENKLRRVCSNDESWDGLEESIKTVFQGKIQQFEPQVNERRFIAIRWRDLRLSNGLF